MRKIIVFYLFTLPFLMTCTSVTQKTTGEWPEITEKGLREVYQVLLENHPGAEDRENPYFRRWMEEGLVDAGVMANRVVSHKGYIYTMRYYVNGFKDGHLDFIPQKEAANVKWAGIVMAFRNNKYIVHSISQDKGNFPDLPLVGSELFGCDGRLPKGIMRDNIYRFYGNEDITSSLVLVTPHIFIDDDNPLINLPQTCIFQIAQKRETFKLKWVSTEEELLKDRLMLAGVGIPPEFQIREVSDKWIWISIPKFFPEGDEISKMEKIIQDIGKYRSEKNIIFDVRGNTGGSSAWGTRIVKAYFGKRYYQQSIEPSLFKGVYVDWRISKGNERHLEKLIEFLKDKFGEKSEEVEAFIGIHKGMKKSLEKGETYYRSSAIEGHQVTKETDRVTSTQGKAIVITDAKCASACLDFMDELMATGRVMHVGQPTSADTLYMENRRVDLSSELGSLVFATKVYRNRPRGHNVFYTPQHHWKGDIWDTKALEKWVLSLTANL